MAIDSVPVGNIYPTADSASLGARSGAFSAFRGVPVREELEATEGEQSVTLGGATSIWGAGLTFLALLILLMFAAKNLGEGEEFRNIKVSFYNVMVIGLAVIVSIPVYKYLFSKLPVPGISAWVKAV